jgi:hypothetical protein
MSAFMHSAVSFGTPDMPPPGVGSSIAPISLHNAIEDGFSEVELPLYGVLGSFGAQEERSGGATPRPNPRSAPVQAAQGCRSRTRFARGI